MHFQPFFLTISTIFTGRRYDSVRLGKDRFAKTRMEKAESELVQAKYEFVFRSKILDFYRGRPLEL